MSGGQGYKPGRRNLLKAAAVTSVGFAASPRFTAAQDSRHSGKCTKATHWSSEGPFL